VVYTVLLQKRTEKKTFTRFYALSLFPTSQYIKKRDTPRARSHQFLAEEISKGSILVREVAREIRRGRFLRVFESRAFYIFFFSTIRIGCEKRYTFFCDVSLSFKEI